MDSRFPPIQGWDESGSKDTRHLQGIVALSFGQKCDGSRPTLSLRFRLFLGELGLASPDGIHYLRFLVRLDLSRLNPGQREAVLHGEGPLLILAGAGSGKTNTMTHRIAHLLTDRAVPARNILGLSFTNKAAGELRSRVRGLVKKHSPKTSTEGLVISTFHSLCVRMLRTYAGRVGYRPDFTIMDESDQLDVIRQALKHIRVDERKFDPQWVRSKISAAKTDFLTPAEAEVRWSAEGEAKEAFSDALSVCASVYARYQEKLQFLNALDFDDLLFLCVRLLEEDDEARLVLCDRFRHLLVDEYQDTNTSQFRLLQALTSVRKNLCVVGDDDQSIYSWRGADSSHILGFQKHFPTARLITLDQNYRSTTRILEAAHSVIEKNRGRYPKKLWSALGEGESPTLLLTDGDREEAEIVAEEIRLLAHGGKFLPGAARTRSYKDFAILYRSNSQSRAFEEALRRIRVPYRLIGGQSFLERKEVKDVLAYWRLVLNPGDDSAARRALLWPARGIGKTSLEALAKNSLEGGEPFFQTLSRASEIAPRAEKGASVFRALIAKLRADLEALPGTPEALSGWAHESLRQIGLRTALEEECDDALQAQRRAESAEELAHAAGLVRVDSESAGAAPVEGETDSVRLLRHYLTTLVLEGKEEEEDLPEGSGDEVTLLTLHSAKGLEFPIVFLVGLEEGLLPHQRTLDENTDLSEERRLCYVGITRAQEKLFLTRAKSRVRWGKVQPRNPSRFIADLPQDLLVVRDTGALPDLSSVEKREQHEEKVLSFLADFRARIDAVKPPKR